MFNPKSSISHFMKTRTVTLTLLHAKRLGEGNRRNVAKLRGERFECISEETIEHVWYDMYNGREHERNDLYNCSGHYEMIAIPAVNQWE
jgi:hypothetical protein